MDSLLPKLHLSNPKLFHHPEEQNFEQKFLKEISEIEETKLGFVRNEPVPLVRRNRPTSKILAIIFTLELKNFLASAMGR